MTGKMDRRAPAGEPPHPREREARVAASWRPAALAALLLLAVSAPARADEALVVQDVDRSRPPQVSAVVVVPALLAGRSLPSSAFSAEQAGKELPVTAERVVDGTAELVLALDASDAEDLRAEQSAAADLLRMLPPELPTVVLPGAVRGTARSALTAVGALRRSDAGLLDDLPPSGGASRLLVVLTGCPALDGVPEAARGSAQTSVLVQGRDCDSEAAALAGDNGLLRTGLSDAGLLSSVDDVGRGLLGQYRVRFDADPAQGAVELGVSDGAVRARAQLPLPGSTTPAGGAASVRPGPVTAPAPAGSSGLSAVPVALAALLAAVAGLGVLAALLADRRRRAA